MFDNIIKTFIKNEGKTARRKDIKFIPVTLNYDIVYEGETFPMELLGESKIPESLMRMIKQLTHFQKNLGKIIIKYGDPISLREYISSYCEKKNETPQTLISDLAIQDKFVAKLGKDLS